MTFVEVRAFRGTRLSSVYRCCVFPSECVDRMRRLADRRGLTALTAALRSPDRDCAEVSKSGARDLAHDVATLRLSGELLELDDELAELAEVANWCSRAPRKAWLVVLRREPS